MSKIHFEENPDKKSFELKKLFLLVTFILFGIWLIFDGILSIMIMYYQPLIYHIPRIIRSSIGVAIIIISLYLYKKISLSLFFKITS